jgi:hypothetical protein
MLCKIVNMTFYIKYVNVIAWFPPVPKPSFHDGNVFLLYIMLSVDEIFRMEFQSSCNSSDINFLERSG